MTTTEKIPEKRYKAVKTAENQYSFIGSVVTPKPVPAPPVQPQAEPEHVSLLDLSDRQLARTALRATWYDMKTFGRTHMYDIFKQRLQDERDAQQMVDLHIVDAVHCRLHEKMVARARGTEA